MTVIRNQSVLDFEPAGSSFPPVEKKATKKHRGAEAILAGIARGDGPLRFLNFAGPAECAEMIRTIEHLL